MLQWREVNIPFAAGLQTKTDPRALQPPALVVARNIEFDEVGGLQKRKPYSSIGANILGGGTISNARRMYANGDELVLFTKDSLYTWSARDTAWVLRGTHLAAKLTERSVFVDPTEQVSTDRCEVGNCVIYAWVKNHATATSRTVWVAAQDKTTGAVILPPTQPNDGVVTGMDRPRLTALASVALLFYVDSAGNLVVLSLTPGSLAANLTVAPTSILAAASFGADRVYDAVSDGTVAFFAAHRNPTTSYEAGFVTSALSITQATKTQTANTSIAIAVSPNAINRVTVGRSNGTAMRADILNRTTLADVSMNLNIGTAASATVNQITACYRTTQVAGEWSCHIIWGAGEAATGGSGGNTFQLEGNTVNNAAAIGSETTLYRQLSLASRAFDHDGRVYFWGVFACDSGTAFDPTGFKASLQNTYFLFRDDGFMVAKAAMHKAAGFRSVTGHLPGVQSLGSNVYAFAGGERRVISVGSLSQSKYSARAPRDIKVEFDSNEARRCARLGDTLYIASGEILQYDGRQLIEVGFHIYPWQFLLTFVGGAPGVTIGTKTYRLSYRHDNSKGERDRSTTATHISITTAATGDVLVTDITPLRVSHKSDIAVEVWATAIDPTIDVPFYLITDQDPTVLTGSNLYIPNNATTSTHLVNDAMPDATLTTKEVSPENGGILENLAPPAASIVAATQDRLFLAGMSDDPHQVWYSKLRGSQEVAAFHDALTIQLPPDGGDITALGFLNETLIVFKESAIYALPGDGFDNAGDGQNYGPARLLASDVGAVRAEAVALTPRGIVFHSQKGWYLLTQGWAVEYIGGPVADFDTDTFVAVHVVEKQHQVRCLSSSARLLVWDYLVGQWAEWTVADGLHAAVWGGTYHYLATAAVKAEQTTYTAADYHFDIETAWIKMADLQGFHRVRRIMLLGEYRSAHDVRIRVARDYLASSGATTFFDDKYWTTSPTTVGGPLQVRHSPSIQKVEAIKLRITDYASGSTTNPPAGEALRLTGVALQYGVKPGLYRRLPVAQKQ